MVIFTNMFYQRLSNLYIFHTLPINIYNTYNYVKAKIMIFIRAINDICLLSYIFKCYNKYHKLNVFISFEINIFNIFELQERYHYRISRKPNQPDQFHKILTWFSSDYY